MHDLTQHLIDRVLPAAYTPRPGQPAPRYSEQQARQVLAFLARQMNQDNTRDLAWWQISRWAPPRPRILVSMLAGGLLGAVLGGLTSVLGEALGAGLGYVLRVKNDLWGQLSSGKVSWRVSVSGSGLASCSGLVSGAEAVSPSGSGTGVLSACVQS